MENPSIVLNLGCNFPTGKAELSLLEFQTSSLVSNNIFGMRTPNFGQGLNVTAGFTWAIPMTEALVIGLGASYQRKGGFKPLDVFVEDYRPGDEILLTGGFDIRLGSTSTLSSDVTLTLYNSDKIGDDEVFSIGNKFVLYTQFRQFFGFNELRVLARLGAAPRMSAQLFWAKSPSRTQCGHFPINSISVHNTVSGSADLSISRPAARGGSTSKRWPPFPVSHFSPGALRRRFHSHEE